jgi:hypothetical protein
MTLMNYPRSGLTALLDALERELLAAPADEVRDAWRATVRDAWRATGRARDCACEEVRKLLDDAIAASDDGPTATLPPDARAGPDRFFGTPRKLWLRADGLPRLSASPAWSCRRH